MPAAGSTPPRHGVFGIVPPKKVAARFAGIEVVSQLPLVCSRQGHVRQMQKVRREGVARDGRGR